MKRLNNRGDVGAGVLGALAVIVILALIVTPFAIYRHAKYASQRQLTFTVTKLPDRNVYGGSSQSHSYANLVYTNKGTLQNVDSTFPWKRQSSDIYAQLVQGKTYTCTVAGWRNGFFSSYPNIIRCEGFYP